WTGRTASRTGGSSTLPPSKSLYAARCNNPTSVGSRKPKIGGPRTFARRSTGDYSRIGNLACPASKVTLAGDGMEISIDSLLEGAERATGTAVIDVFRA